MSCVLDAHIICPGSVSQAVVRSCLASSGMEFNSSISAAAMILLLVNMNNQQFDCDAIIF